jgi:hypothetical protein
MMHHDMPQMAFAGTLEQCRGRGAHLALLHRRVEDAARAGAREIFAITEDALAEKIDALARSIDKRFERLEDRFDRLLLRIMGGLFAIAAALIAAPHL